MAQPIIPAGIRRNNPGNLRSAYGSDLPVKREGSFAVFPTLEAGLVSLCCLTADYYGPLACRTPRDFVNRYAPSSENNTVLYISVVCRAVGINPASDAIYDLQLDKPGRAFDWMQAICRMENGIAPLSMPWTPHWFSPGLLIAAMRDSLKWPM